MGLDIYAGTLTRYYSHNWKTAVQQWAEENGYTFNRITPDGETADDGEELSPAEVQAVVENWRDQILGAITQPGQEPYAPWPEDNEKPYYTDKPDWDAFFFQAPLPTDDQAMIATLGGLRKELERLNQMAWQVDEDTILDWADTEGYPADGAIDSDGQYSKADIPEHTEYDTQSLAKFAFSMFWQALRFAEKQQVPILLDY